MRVYPNVRGISRCSQHIPPSLAKVHFTRFLVTSHCQRRHRSAIFLRIGRALGAAQWHSQSSEWRPILASAKTLRVSSTQAQMQAPETVTELESKTKASMAVESSKDIVWDGVTLPLDDDYNGAGRLLKTHPRETLYHGFQGWGGMELHINVPRIDSGHFLCIIQCKIMHTSEKFSIYKVARGKSDAENVAIKALISRLHTTGIFRSLLGEFQALRGRPLMFKTSGKKPEKSKKPGANKQPEKSKPEKSRQPESNEKPGANKQPKESQPKESQPKESQPKESQPKESQPKESQPKESQPKESQPKEKSKPEESKQLEENRPEENKPEQGQHKNRRNFLKLLLHENVLAVMDRSLRDLRKVLPAIDSSNYETRPTKDQELEDPEEEPEMNRQLRPADSARKAGYDLPVGQMHKEVLDLIENNTYSLIAADAGSGKSTQVPQILLDNALSTGSKSQCRIICVQPRRIAAISLAHRVARERGQPVGRDVGYRVRFQSRYSTGGGTITYCTTELFLNLVNHQPTLLDSVTHIILDEVHERNLALDLLMLTVKKMIEGRRAVGAPVPKVTAMSATLDVDLLSSYFRSQSNDGTILPAPCLQIPGRAFPVEKHYLDEIFESLSQTYSPGTLWSLYTEPSTDHFLKQHGYRLNPPEEVLNQAAVGMPSSLPKIKSPLVEDVAPLGLVCAVIGHILSTTHEGSILVFLPGLRHIEGVEQALEMYGELLGHNFADTRRYHILPLHSSLSESQMEAFRMGPSRRRRIILSTDIAETSVTLPDVRFVIDLGKVNLSVYDPLQKSSRLTCSWASLSSVTQRAGRAGRVQSGEYFALFTKEMHDALRITRPPEIRRADLRRSCLQVKKASFDSSIQDTLQQTIEPPNESQVHTAIKDLQDLGALGEQEELTPLGNALTSLHLDPAQAKLVLLGIIFRCLDPLIIIATLPTVNSLFLFTNDDEKKRQIQRSNMDFAQGTWSDHLGSVHVYRTMRKVLHRSGRSKAVEFALSRNISFDGFDQLKSAAHQVFQRLISQGLIRLPSQRTNDLRFGGPDLNVNSGHVPLIKALLFSTLPTHLAAPYLDLKGRYYTRTSRLAGPSMISVNGHSRPTSLLAFDATFDMGRYMVLHNTSHITPLVACLLGGRLQGTEEKVRLNSWLVLDVETDGGLRGNHAVKHLIELRKALELAMSATFDVLVRSERQPNPNLLRTVSKALIDVLNHDSDPVYDQRDEAGAETGAADDS